MAKGKNSSLFVASVSDAEFSLKSGGHLEVVVFAVVVAVVAGFWNRFAVLEDTSFFFQ